MLEKDIGGRKPQAFQDTRTEGVDQDVGPSKKTKKNITRFFLAQV
jgi:hypothetical protein